MSTLAATEIIQDSYCEVYIYAAMVPINTCRLYATVATAGLAQEALHYTFC